jgi:hypothetical protein
MQLLIGVGKKGKGGGKNKNVQRSQHAQKQDDFAFVRLRDFSGWIGMGVVHKIYRQLKAPLPKLKEIPSA